MKFEYWYDHADRLWYWHLREGEHIIARSDKGDRE